MALITQHCAKDMRWLAPGHHQLSGFMARVGERSKNSFQMRNVVTMNAEDYSADVTNNTGHRAGDPSRVLDIDVIHWTQWRDGKVNRARGVIFAEGTAQYNAFRA
jgi:uncharacterized protein